MAPFVFFDCAVRKDSCSIVFIDLDEDQVKQKHLR